MVVLRGNRVEEFDFESAHRKQLRGNIYLAKVTRVEPSLQAAFVDYGGNRHGFLAFSEIHPDYYQIPVADRQALIDEEERAQRAADDEVDRRSRRAPRPRPAMRPRTATTTLCAANSPKRQPATRPLATRRPNRQRRPKRPNPARRLPRADAAAARPRAAGLDRIRARQRPEPRARRARRGRDDIWRQRPLPIQASPRQPTRLRDTAPDTDEQGNGAHAGAEGDNGGENGENGENGGDEEAEIVESVGGADAHGRSARPRAALPPPVQDPGSDQAPPGHAGAGGQGGTRHQGRGADDLPVARRPLFGADAQYRARRRHQPQDHQLAKIAPASRKPRPGP